MDSSALKKISSAAIDAIRKEFELKRDASEKAVAIEVLEELKRRLHAISPVPRPGEERCPHQAEALATVYWLQHQIKVGEYTV